MFNDRVIANSEATRRYHRRFNLVGGKRIETIHCFVDYDRFATVAQSSRQAIRAEFGLSEDDLLVGQVGHVCARKGQLHLVRAMPSILAEFPQTRLVVVGCDQTAKYKKYTAKAKQEAKRLRVDRQVIWTGFRSDVPEILTALDVFVLASLEEAQGLAPLEAMIGELPVVATAVGGLPELVKPGETGILVPPADPPALAKAILQLLGDTQLRHRLGVNGHETVKRQFCAATQVPRIEAALVSAAEKRKAA